MHSSNNGQVQENDIEAYYALKLSTKPKENVNITLKPPVESNFLLSLEAINRKDKNGSTNISFSASRIVHGMRMKKIPIEQTRLYRRIQCLTFTTIKDAWLDLAMTKGF